MHKLRQIRGLVSELPNQITSLANPKETEETVGFAECDELDQSEEGVDMIGGYQGLAPSPGLRENGQPDDPEGYQQGTSGQPMEVFQAEGGGELMDGKNQIGPWSAGWNVTNAIQGMFLVSLPYATLHGGWWALFALVGVAYICYYTGLILVDCLYEKGQRVRNSYVQIAEAVWGPRVGGRIVHLAQLIELLMTDILYVVLCGDLLEGSFPSAAMDKMGWMMFSTILLLSCAFLTNLRAVSRLSFANTVSHVIINAVILLYCLSKAGRWNFGKISWSMDIRIFPTVLGIVVFSYTSQIFLPTLEGNMVDKQYFRPMLKWSHIAAAAFKSIFGMVGFLTFGAYTQEEVTNNLPTQDFKSAINLILVFKALLSYPLPYYAAVELLETAFFKGKPRTPFPSCFSEDGSMREWGLALRVCLVLFTLFMAISIPHFALLMGLIGNFTGCMLSFIWPCIFHLKLKKAELPKYIIIWDYTVIGMGVVFGGVGVIYSSAALARAMNSPTEYY